MNNGMMFLILGLGLLWLLGGNKQKQTWVGGSQAEQMTAAYDIGF